MKIVGIMLGIFLSIAAYAESGNAAERRTAPAQNFSTSFAKAGTGFHGKVEQVIESSHVLTIKGRSGVVTFDVSNPVLIGYGSISDIRIGDFVGVQYTHNSIRVIKAGSEKRNVIIESEIINKVKPVPDISAIKPQQNISRSNKLQRQVRKSGGDNNTFDDVDANKDGKLSPIELSTIVRDLTMEKFKQYDKNGNGYLDRKEYKCLKE